MSQKKLSPVEQFRLHLNLPDLNAVAKITGIPAETLTERHRRRRLESHEEKLLACLCLLYDLDQYTRKFKGRVSFEDRRRIADLIGREPPRLGRLPKVYLFHGEPMTARDLAEKLGYTHKTMCQYLNDVPSGVELTQHPWRCKN